MSNVANGRPLLGKKNTYINPDLSFGEELEETSENDDLAPSDENKIDKNVTRSTSKTKEEQDDLNKKLCELVETMEGNRKAVEELIKKGADVNFTNDVGRTPLHMAAISGNIDAVEMLLAAGANPNARDNSGKTPLDYARQRGNTRIASMLNQKMVMSTGNLDMLISSLYRAIQEGNYDIAGNISADIIKFLQKRASREKSPLHKAILDGNFDEVKNLVERGGFDVNALNDLGHSPLLYATFKGNKDIANYLVERGADPNINIKGLGKINFKKIMKELERAKKMMNEQKKEKMKKFIEDKFNDKIKKLQEKVEKEPQISEKLKQKIDELERQKEDIMKKIDSLSGQKLENLEKSLGLQQNQEANYKAIRERVQKYFNEQEKLLEQEYEKERQRLEEHDKKDSDNLKKQLESESKKQQELQQQNRIRQGITY